MVTILPSNSVAKLLNVGNSSKRKRFLACDLGGATNHVRGSCENRRLIKIYSLRISVEDFTATLGKDLYTIFTLAHFGYR